MMSDDGQDAGEVGDGGEVDGDGAGLQGERGVIGVPAPIAHAGREDGLDQPIRLRTSGMSSRPASKLRRMVAGSG